MSLIGDALKKAHLEAVQQDGGIGMRHTPGVAQFRPRPTSKSRVAIALAASNVFLVLLVAGFAFWGWSQGIWGQKDPVTPAAALATTEPAAPAQAPAELVAASAEAELPPAHEPARSPEPSVAPSNGSAARTSPPAPVVAVAPAPETARREPARVADGGGAPHVRQPSNSRHGLVDGQTYMRSVPVPGGSEILLNGLSVAGGRGVALLNGRMVREGDRVGPFTVGSIADRKVQLHFEDITIYLRLP